MKRKAIGIIAVIVVVLGLSLVVYNQIIPNEYVPAADEIALHIQFATEEDIGAWPGYPGRAAAKANVWAFPPWGQAHGTAAG